MKKFEPYILFLLGFGIFMFTRRSELLPSIHIANVIAPIFILRFIRTQPAGRAILFSFLGFLLSLNISLWGLFKIDNSSTMILFNSLRSSLLAILYIIPFAVDRLIWAKYKENKFFSILTYPVIATAVFFLSSLEGPFDGAGMSGKFVYGPLTFIQVISIFGIWIFVFVYSWLASIINYAWENSFRWRKIKNHVISLVLVFGLILIYGILKTALLKGPDQDTVKIAAAVLIPEENEDIIEMEKVYHNKITFPYEKTVSRIEELTRKAALNGAKIITFQEFAITVNQEDETKLRERYKDIARENQIFLSITYAYFIQNGKGENKHLLIDDKGEIQLDYAKRYLLGFKNHGETVAFRKGPEVIQTYDSPYGKIGISICRDMTFQGYVKQAGRKDVDIMLAPSYDWPKSTGPSYTLRAIENGFSFVRATYNGVSFAEDYNGNILTQMDSDKTSSGIMYAEIPIGGIKTLYPLMGDFLGWCCVVSMLAMIFVPVRMKKVLYNQVP